jgi:hypothetical protein
VRQLDDPLTHPPARTVDANYGFHVVTDLSLVLKGDQVFHGFHGFRLDGVKKAGIPQGF